MRLAPARVSSLNDSSSSLLGMARLVKKGTRCGGSPQRPRVTGDAYAQMYLRRRRERKRYLRPMQAYLRTPSGDYAVPRLRLDARAAACVLVCSSLEFSSAFFARFITPGHSIAPG